MISYFGWQMRAKHAVAGLGSLAALPFVAAATTSTYNPLAKINVGVISQTMTKMWSIVGAIVNIDPTVAPTVIKVFVFLLLFALIFWVLNAKVFVGDRKISGVIAFAIAGMVALISPNSGLIYVLISVTVPLAIILGLVALAWYMDWFTGSPGKNAMGALVIFVAWLIDCFLIENLPNWVQPAEMRYVDLFMPVLVFLSVALLFLIAGKLIAGLFDLGTGAASAAAGGGFQLPEWMTAEGRHRRRMRARERDAEAAENENRIRNRLENPGLRIPTTVQSIQFREDPTNPSQVLIEWKPNEDSEHVTQYEVHYSTSPPPVGAAPAGHTPGGVTYHAVGNTTSPRIIMSSGIPPKGTLIHFAVRAYNVNGWGPYGFSSYGETTGSPSPVRPIHPLEARINNILGTLTSVQTNEIALALRSLETLRVYDPATKSLTRARFPVIRPGNPEWPEAFNAITQFRNGSAIANNAAHELSGIALDPQLRANAHLISLHIRAMRRLRFVRTQIAKISGGVILATGVRP